MENLKKIFLISTICFACNVKGNEKNFISENLKLKTVLEKNERQNEWYYGSWGKCIVPEPYKYIPKKTDDTDDVENIKGLLTYTFIKYPQTIEWIGIPKLVNDFIQNTAASFYCELKEAKYVKKNEIMDKFVKYRRQEINKNLSLSFGRVAVNEITKSVKDGISSIYNKWGFDNRS